MVSGIERGMDNLLYARDNGISLKALIPPYVERHKGKPGPRISPKIIWLSDALETAEFWQKLHLHLIDDEGKRRQSTAGVFYRESGQKKVGEYTFNEIFNSLNNFLKHDFNLNATEFIFRDFKPKDNDKTLLKNIQNTRRAALDLFPRLRRLNWNEYKEALNTTDFWIGMYKDLERLEKPTAPTAFFSNIATPNKSDISYIKTQMEKKMMYQFIRRTGKIEKRALLLDYRSMSQIIQGMFQENPRTFFLNYKSDSLDPQLQQIIAQTKLLIEKNVLPVKSIPEKIKEVSKKELKKIIQTREFWQDLSRDFDKQMSSKQPVYSLNYFLRHYDVKENEVIPGRMGTYAYLSTPFTLDKRGATRLKIVNPSKKLVMELMWEFKPEENIKELVMDAKRKALEFFPQDCLYVELQTPEFWKRIENDINKTRKKMSFVLFLRYFNSDKNINASGRLHKPNNAPYQRFLHRSYHEPKELKSLCKYLKLPIFDDYKENLETLFLHLAPDPLKKLLKLKFPISFDKEAKQNRKNEVIIFDRVKNLLMTLQHSPEITIRVSENTQDIDKLRQKVETAARSLKVRINTSIENKTTIVVTVRKRKKLNNTEMKEAEKQVKELIEQGLTNKEIAEKLDMEKDYNVEYIAGKLVKRGELQPRYKYKSRQRPIPR